MRIDKSDMLSLIDSKYSEETLEVINYIENRNMPYERLSRDKVVRAALVWILKYKGNTYMSNKLYNLFNKLEIDYKEVYETLVNGNIIDRKPTKYISNIIGEDVTFQSSKGINRSFYIRLKKEAYPFKIRYISNTYRGFIECKFENRELENVIDIKISIPEEVGYEINIEECIVIYTDYKILFYRFKVIKVDEVVQSSFYDVKILNTLKLMKERTRRIVSIRKGMSRLEEVNTWEYAREYLSTIKNKDVAVELFSMYKKIKENNKRELPIKVYAEILESFIDSEEVDVKLAYLIEEFIVKMTLIKKRLCTYLEKLYLDGYRSDLTNEVIEILKFSDISLELKKHFKLIDTDVIEDFKKGNVSLEMANKILNSKGILYDERLTKIIYDFYSETDDMIALEKVILKGEKYKIFPKEGEIVSLINKKKEGVNVPDKIIIKGGERYSKKNNYIKNQIEFIKLESLKMVKLTKN